MLFIVIITYDDVIMINIIITNLCLSFLLWKVGIIIAPSRLWRSNERVFVEHFANLKEIHKCWLVYYCYC